MCTAAHMGPPRARAALLLAAAALLALPASCAVPRPAHELSRAAGSRAPARAPVPRMRAAARSAVTASAARATPSGGAAAGGAGVAGEVTEWKESSLKLAIDAEAAATTDAAATLSPLDPASWFGAILESASAPVGAAGLEGLRASGAAELREMMGSGQLPDSKAEAWRHVGVRGLFARQFASAPAAGADAASAAGAAAAAAGGAGGTLDVAGGEGAEARVSPNAIAHAVFVDGAYAPELSDTSRLPAGAYVGGLAGLAADDPRRAAVLAQAAEKARGENTLGVRDDGREGALGGGSFWALNTAAMVDVACVLLADGVALPADSPVHLTFLTTGAASAAPAASACHPRLAVDLGSGSAAQLVVAYADAPSDASAAAALSNAVSHLRVGEGARLEHAIVVERGAFSHHVETVDAAVCADGQYLFTTLQGPAALSRVNVGVDLLGRGAYARARGLALSGSAPVAKGKQGAGGAPPPPPLPSAVDLHTAVRHLTAGCESSQVQKNVVAGKGRAVFRGLIRANGDAAETVANQLCRSMLLNDGAKVDVAPCLEIIADDVQCTHGATVADLDEEKVFYFRARGIGADAARYALVRGFADEILQLVPYEGAKLRMAATAMGLIPAKESKRIDTTGWSSI